MATKHHAGLLAAGVVISRHGPRFIVAYLKSEDPGIEPPFYLTVWEWHQNDQYSLVALAKGILSFCLQGHSSCMYHVYRFECLRNCDVPGDEYFKCCEDLSLTMTEDLLFPECPF
jgi:hypothetical protein